jgi:hypothetical protein
MKKRTQYLISVAGVIFTVVGVLGAVPLFLKGHLAGGIFSATLVVAGLILLAIAFGED